MKSNDLCNDGQSCCFQRANTTCSINDLPPNESTFIHPGGDTGCLTSLPYRFEVIPGQMRRKMLLYFQGGGGCWNPLTSQLLRPCSIDALPEPDSPGVFNREDVNNPYKDWTIVHVLYCSGDLHVGNAMMPYKDFISGEPIKHWGARNIKAVLRWIHDQKFDLEDLILMGCSAGCVGVQLFSNEILNTFKYKNAAVVLDSFVGTTADGVAPYLYKKNGLCSSTDILKWNLDLQLACEENRFTTPMVLDAQIKAYPHIPFIAINSKADIVQRIAYFATSGHFWVFKASLWYDHISKVMDQLAENPNFATFFVEGTHHCFTNAKWFMSTYASGVRNTNVSTTKSGVEVASELLTTYLKQLPLKPGCSIASFCFGNYVSGDNPLDYTQCSIKQHAVSVASIPRGIAVLSRTLRILHQWYVELNSKPRTPL